MLNVQTTFQNGVLHIDAVCETARLAGEDRDRQTSADPLSRGTVDLIGHRNHVILKESQRLKNLPLDLNAPNNIRSRATSREDSSHSLDAPLRMTFRSALDPQSPGPMGVRRGGWTGAQIAQKRRCGWRTR
jgi:hypothetical protein